MKKICRLLSLVAVAALCFSACTEELNNDKINGGKTVTVHFGTENTDPSTKATLTSNEGETAFQAAWEDRDEISIEYISPEANNAIITGTWDATNKKFSATLPNEKGSWAYQAAYPVPSASDNSVDFGPNRTQKGNAYNSKYDIMIGSAVAENAAAGKDEAGKDIVFKMTRQTAIAYFHFTSKLNEAVTSATLTVSGEGAAIASNYAYVSNFAWAPAEDCQSITITFPEQAPNAQDFQLWFNVLPTIYESMTLTVETATKTFTISKSTIGEYVTGKLYKVKKSGIAWTDKPTKVYFYESFNSTNGTGGNDEKWSGSIASNNVIYDHDGWSAENAGGANQCLKLGSGTKKGSATTPELGIDSYSVSLWFKAAAWNASNEGTTIKLLISGSGTISPTSVSLVKGEWSEYECTITGADATTKIVFEAVNTSNNRFFIDEVYVYSGPKPEIVSQYTVSTELAEGGTLSATPSKAEAGAEVTLIATPDAEYTFNNDWTVTNTETSEVITVTDGKFTMPAANVNVSASFTQKTYTIKANTAENGTYTVKVGDAEVTSAVKGAKVVLEATPAQGYICDGWTVVDAENNSVKVSNNSFTMPASAVTISTTFSIKPEDITYDHAGTAEDPYSVADVLKFISTLGTATSTNDVYAKGVITSITEVSTKYGNATYTIKDEGVENEVLVFRGLYLDGADFTSEDQIRVGDEVVVKGKVKNHNNNTPEFVSGNSLVSIVKAPYLNVTASKETGIAAAGETVTITVDTNVDSWTATSNNAAFVVGSPSGNTVDVTVADNTGEERTATITVRAGTLSKTITLTQSAAGASAKIEKTAKITFGTNNVKINAASVTANDDCSNSWTITTAGTTSFTPQPTYFQVGSGSNPATSITFTTTLPYDAEVGLIEAKFGGFKGTAGTVSLKVGDTSVGSGSLNASNDVTVSSTSTAAGKVVTVSITDISKGVKCYYIKVVYKTAE